MHFWVPKFSTRSIMSINDIIKDVSNTFKLHSFHYLNKQHWKQITIPGYIQIDDEIPERTDLLFLEQGKVLNFLSFFLLNTEVIIKVVVLSDLIQRY